MTHTLIHYELYIREKLVLDRFKSISALTKDYHNSKVKIICQKIEKIMSPSSYNNFKYFWNVIENALDCLKKTIFRLNYFCELPSSDFSELTNNVNEN